MTVISDFLESLRDLETEPDAPTKATMNETTIQLQTDASLELWDGDELVFRGALNAADSSGGGLIWGKGFYGCTCGMYESAQWHASHRGVEGRGNTPELAFDAMVQGLPPKTRTVPW